MASAKQKEKSNTTKAMTPRKSNKPADTDGGKE